MGVQELAIYGLAMGSGGCAALVAYPAVSRLWSGAAGRVEEYQRVKVTQATKALDDIFVEVKPWWLHMAYGLGPLGAGLIAFLLSNNLLLTVVCMGAGVLVPDFLVRASRAQRRAKFGAQLLDAVSILSSSIRAGLSLTQAFEELEREMPPPISQEIGLMLKAHRLGRPLEEALQKVGERMPSQDLNLLITSVLVARETGGDITVIFNRLMDTIRNRQKLHQKVTTLTLQGRLQAYIMSALPVLFLMFTRASSPQSLDVLLQEPMGQMALMLAGVLWVVGMVLLMKLSQVRL